MHDVARIRGERFEATQTSTWRRSPLVWIALALALPTASATAQVAVPFRQANLQLNSLSSQVGYTVALSSLPERPVLIAEVVPDEAHPDMSIQVEISGCTLVNPQGSCSAPPPATGTGPQSTRWNVYRCVLGQTFPVPQYVGKTCNVNVRATSFGSAGAPAHFDLTIRGETVVPTGTNSSSITTNFQSVSIAPTKDTTIYRASTTASNGLGESLWALLAGGVQYRTLIAFDVNAAVPAGATILDAHLELTPLSPTVSGSLIDLYALSRVPAVPWTEGTANAADPDELTPPAPVNNAATWTHRNWSSLLPQGAWVTHGGDVLAPRLAQARVDLGKTLVINTPELVAHVAAIHASNAAADGLLIVPGKAAHVSRVTRILRPRFVPGSSWTTPRRLHRSRATSIRIWSPSSTRIRTSAGSTTSTMTTS